MKFFAYTNSLCLVLFHLSLISFTLIYAFPTDAQQEQKEEFGKFEARLPGLPETIDEALESKTPLITYVNIVINVITGLIVIIGLISVLVGGYFYMTAGGSAERVGMAKTIIGSALAGIVIAMVGWLILNTISPQFTSQVQEPPPPQAN